MEPADRMREDITGQGCEVCLFRDLDLEAVYKFQYLIIKFISVLTLRHVFENFLEVLAKLCNYMYN